MVFLPCHKSHMDYLILSIALINIGIKVSLEYCFHVYYASPPSLSLLLSLFPLYLLLSFHQLPHIAAGDNLNIPIFRYTPFTNTVYMYHHIFLLHSYFIHRLGGFFIRRKLDAGSKRDDLYRECLQEYIEQLLRANENIELYIGEQHSTTTVYW